jgi:outer membrane lipoprotein-sorting protein
MKKRKHVLFAMILASTITSGALAAQTLTGMEVMEQVYTRPTGENMYAELTMTITNSRGSTRDRSISQYRISDDAAGVEKKIMFFTAPADVRNTSFLSWSYADGRNDDQWMYLPALRRVKRIAAGNTTDSFMGSDFTYDDMGERHPSEDTHTILREESYRGSPCYVVESVPNDSSSLVSRTLSWVVKDEWIGLKKEYYDDSGKLVKTLNIDEAKKVDGYWVISDMTMTDLQKKSSTRIRMENVNFSRSLNGSLFTERQMKIGPPR